MEYKDYGDEAGNDVNENNVRRMTKNEALNYSGRTINNDTQSDFSYKKEDFSCIKFYKCNGFKNKLIIAAIIFSLIVLFFFVALPIFAILVILGLVLGIKNYFLQ